MQYRCNQCGKEIEHKYGKCQECIKIKQKEQINKRFNRQVSKLHDTVEWGVTQVKKLAEGRLWATSHQNCYRASIGKCETEQHIRTKFERWLFHRQLGRTVFCELRLKEPYGRPDLIIVDKGNIFIEEIVKSETEASIVLKKNKYPWKVKVIYAKNHQEVHDQESI